jgi:ABC-type methionine transport system ATPase subunit
MQETVRVQLNFELDRVKEPVIWHLSHHYRLKFSIRYASIDIDKGGYTVVDLSGERADIDAGLAWALDQGVEISALGINGANEWAI